jgi:hypothetical protein
MADLDLPFPISSTPGILSGEGEGQLINAYSEKLGATDVIRRVPGQTAFATITAGATRGLLEIANLVFAVSGTTVERITNVETFGALTGSLGGAGLVTLAANNAAQVVAVRDDGGAYVIDLTGLTVSAYPDADLPADVNSVSLLGGYFLFTRPNGQIWASDLNSTAVNALSFATAEQQADGLVRGISFANTFYAMGQTSIEPWLNAGTTPFPLRRATSTIGIGLLTAAAVAGHEPGWGGNPTFVASDGTVRELRGYDPVQISTPAVERFIAASAAATLEACVYMFRGHRIWSLSSSTGTWEYNASLNRWHERVTAGAARWQARRSVWVPYLQRWVVGNYSSGPLAYIDEANRTEVGTAITAVIKSGALRAYPARISIPHLYADFSQAAGATVSAQFSVDGGLTWTTPQTRALDDAQKRSVRWNRLGLATHNGLRASFEISANVDFSFLGASVPDPEMRRP